MVTAVSGGASLESVTCPELSKTCNIDTLPSLPHEVSLVTRIRRAHLNFSTYARISVGHFYHWKILHSNFPKMARQCKDY